MDKIDVQEKIWGGIFGVVAVLAAVAETMSTGISAASLFGMIKDISGTLVVVVVMVALARLLVPKKEAVSFEERLETALSNWQNANSNMIIRNEAMDAKVGNETRYYGLGMKTDMNEFYNEIAMSKQAGWFVRLPVIKTENYNRENVEIYFHLNKETFFGRATTIPDDELKRKFNDLSNKFSDYINRKFAGFARAAGKNDSLKVILNDPITDDEDIARLIDLINTTYTAFLVSSQIRV